LLERNRQYHHDHDASAYTTHIMQRGAVVYIIYGDGGARWRSRSYMITK